MKNFTAIDFETANHHRYSACAIGIVKIANGVVVEKYYSLIQPPGNEYSPICIKVHNIRPEHTADMPTFKDLFPKIRSLIINQELASHSTFDIEVLEAAIKYFSIDDNQLNYKHINTLRLYDGKKLKELCTEYSIPLIDHDALSDAEACAALYLRTESNKDIAVLPRTIKELVSSKSETPRKKLSQINHDFSVMTELNSPFAGKKVVVTGKFENWPGILRDDELHKLLRTLGAIITTKISGVTDFLIAGIDPGPNKMEDFIKVLDQGNDIKLLTETDFLSMINGIRLSRIEDDEFINTTTIFIENNKFFTVSASKPKPPVKDFSTGIDGFLKNVKLVITGNFNKWSSIEELTELMKSHGAYVINGSVNNADYLIAGTDPDLKIMAGHEIYKAMGKDVPILDEEKVIEMLNNRKMD